MKQVLLLVAVVIYITSASSQTKMYITRADGTTDSVSLSQVKGISFRPAAQASMSGTWDMVGTHQAWNPWNGTLTFTDNIGTLTGSIVIPQLGSVANAGTILASGIATIGGDLSFAGNSQSGYRHEIKALVDPLKTRLMGTFIVNGMTFEVTATKR